MAKNAMKGAGARKAGIEAAEVAKGAVKGIIGGTKQAGVITTTLVDHAADAALDAAKEAGDKVVEVVKDTLEEVYEAVKGAFKKKG